MNALQTSALQLPPTIDPNEQGDLQRSFILHLLSENKLEMADALDQLSDKDQQWLVNAILQTAQENLFIACHISDEFWAQKYWTRYGDLLGHLFDWYHQDTDVSYHGQLLSILRTIVRRYAPCN